MTPKALRSDPEKLLRQIMARFVAQEVAPLAQEIDESGEFPMELFKKLAEMQAFGIRYAKNKGGSGGNCTLYCIMCEELAKGLLSLAAVAAKQCLMATNFLYRFGADEIKERYFMPAMRGEMLGSFCLTEPEAGGDLGRVTTTATDRGDHWLIQGMKTWITNAPLASFFTVLCQSDPEKGIRGLNFFLLPRDTKGLTVSPSFELLGTRTTQIGEVAFDNCLIPKDHLLGKPGKGLGALLSILAEIRAMTAALALGLSKAAYETSFQYAQERSQFGKTINNYQLIQAKIADMATEIWASELMLYKTAAMIDSGEPCGRESAMLKYFATETACRACDEATRIMGAYAYSSEYPAQRYFRDCRFLLYGGGTHEVLKPNIAREAGFWGAR
ncbi:acyl-CoA dehydrogenase family protein [Dethiosulfatarculus sandiegensis]|uniref:Acyl-CoA dehydrogenase n=1 Tax=Dethiosulfatarculus sandiegensis TaxID=1429043 RepID=A0A0D2J9I8_9BACT|nr:acyl-CoA dehydrogenase family protein [Dethiosulfatarculus sandiegensis]KIX12366.1 acyl-CoA dehydrogenase [Dethiosulfatarculus sandiegensis]